MDWNLCSAGNRGAVRSLIARNGPGFLSSTGVSELWGTMPDTSFARRHTDHRGK